MTNADGEILDWDDLSKEDQERAEQLLKELNNLFRKYDTKEELCEDSTLKE